MKGVPVHFSVTDASLANFGRRVPKPRDCVISALELCGVVSSSAADVLRILVGDIGINFDQIGQIFTTTASTCHVFKTFPANLPECRREVEALVARLPPQQMLFAGFTAGALSHIVVIARTLAGDLVYVDPQQGEPIGRAEDFFRRAELVHVLVRGSGERCPLDVCLPEPPEAATADARESALRRGRALPHAELQDAIRREWLERHTKHAGHFAPYFSLSLLPPYPRRSRSRAR
jgi:hypothetical protein